MISNTKPRHTAVREDPQHTCNTARRLCLTTVTICDGH